MKRILSIAVLGLIMLLPISARAAVFRVPAGDTGTENITKDQKVRNVYAAGSNVNVDADVQKDLFIAGSNLNINGRVEDDLMGAGNTINVKGPIEGSARIAGAIINLDNNVDEDLLVAGNEINISDKSRISGDLILAANSAQIKGNINGDIKLVGSEVIISGTIDGDVVAKNVNKLTIKNTAVIGGKLIYQSPNEANIESGSKITGGVEYNKIAPNKQGLKNYAKAASVTTLLYQIIGSILLLLLFIYIAPKVAKNFVGLSFKEAFRSSLIGLIVLIVLPIVSLILLAISFKLTMIAMLGYFLFLTLASSFSSLLIGSWVVKNFQRMNEYMINWQSVVIGVILTTVLALIPVIGPLVLFVFLLISFGSLLKLSYVALSSK